MVFVTRMFFFLPGSIFVVVVVVAWLFLAWLVFALGTRSIQVLEPNIEEALLLYTTDNCVTRLMLPACASVLKHPNCRKHLDRVSTSGAPKFRAAPHHDRHPDAPHRRWGGRFPPRR